MKEKIILAYSGGLDTTAIIPWLKENYDYEVICCCIDCGQESELDGLEERAKLSGASKLYIEDVVDVRLCFWRWPSSPFVYLLILLPFHLLETCQEYLMLKCLLYQSRLSSTIFSILAIPRCLIKPVFSKINSLKIFSLCFFLKGILNTSFKK